MEKEEFSLSATKIIFKNIDIFEKEILIIIYLIFFSISIPKLQNNTLYNEYAQKTDLLFNLNKNICCFA